MKGRLFIILLSSLFVLQESSCKKDSTRPPIDENVDLDGGKLLDSSLIVPSLYLLSSAIPAPTPAELAMPVVITVHGFSASNFEWKEFRDWSRGFSDFKVSMVLLGGHGRDYESFKNATWVDWQVPIIEEYNKLRNLGYQKINFLAASAGCPLVLDMVAAGKINPDVLEHIFFVDPIIVPSNKTLSLISVAGPVIGYVETPLDPGENGYWYKYRPYQTLKQLEKFCRKERKELEKGITLPEGVTLRVYKSEKDGSADPVGAVLLKNGVKTSSGGGIESVMVNSDLHVFTRLHGRAFYLPSDKVLQLQTFQEIHSDIFK